MKPLFVFFSFLLLIACNKLCVFSSGTVWLERISWSAHKDANNSMAILFHLVYVYDNETLKKISEKSSTEYFEKHSEILQDFGATMTVREFHVIPGRAERCINVKPKECGAKGAVAFARYNSNETNQRHVLGDEQEIEFIFKKDKLEPVVKKK